MGWVKKLLGGFILVLILLSLAVSFSAYLLATHGSCSPTSTDTGTSSQLLNSTGSSSNSSTTLPQAAPYSSVPLAADLVLAPLANLSLTQGNSSAPADLTSPAFWGQVDSSELQTYEQIVPQTVIGFIDSSEVWKAWAAQNLPDPPSWLDTGFVAQAQSQVSALDPGSNGHGGNATVLEQGVDDFAASAAGVTLASLDFVSFNGLTGMKTLFETSNAELAACQTLPGQLAQLYTSSFDPGVPQAQRADYLGRALAITSVMLLVGGKDAFADRFQTAVGTLGLGDAWPVVKGNLGEVGAKVSAGAASTMLGILQTLAGRFPQDSTFVTGFTAERIDSMVDVLGKNGVPNDVIQNDIGQVAQAAGSASDENAAGDEADILSLQQGHGISAVIQDDRTLARYVGANGKSVSLNGDFLKKAVPGFDPRGPEFIQINYEEAGVTVYHYYPPKNIPVGAPYSTESTNWYPTVPGSVAKPGDRITISFDLLTEDEFVNSIPPINYLNTDRASWVADFSEIKGFALTGNQIVMNVEQETFEGVSSFQVVGTPSQLTNVGGDTFIEFTVPDLVNQPETLKITFNGYGAPVLSFESGSNFGPVTLVSSDGVKLKFVYGSGGKSVATATTYLQQPSLLWNLPAMDEGDLGFPVSGSPQTFTLEGVTPTRDLEKEMVNSGNSYDLGRVGAEIAYTVVQRNFGIENIQLNEPSAGGADLISADKEVTIQARMLGSPSALSPMNLKGTLSFEMNDLVDKIHQDFEKNSNALVGYAVLSYLDPTTKTVVTLVAVIPNEGR